jgi:hypothetical protein
MIRMKWRLTRNLISCDDWWFEELERGNDLRANFSFHKYAGRNHYQLRRFSLSKRRNMGLRMLRYWLAELLILVLAVAQRLVTTFITKYSISASTFELFG